ncbi:hypothetical protein F4561_006594 [Lipingzhangella halophila]|uniref:HNH nuclease domain-containing protein n=1 Tax=Lipingzhangella halophila TaxID=1783352 RepID=A0A7W7W792_9ACTN|nr:HNH endonuclease signature motif containing protein [Lipingzhangella halophila]MBB4935685.1 hypothetical protein [Lipingzhangella halophila]
MAGHPKPVLPRLMSRISVQDDCWEWTGAKNNSGYGQLRVNDRAAYTHRLAYEMFVGSIPEGLVIDHLCRNPACCNPDHLEPVTSGENTRRGEPARRTHCPAGHVYDEQNTGRYANGRRYCRSCHRARQSARKKAQREARGPLPPKAECKNGHPFDEANTYTDRHGYRHCRACKREHMRRSTRKAT